MDDKTVKKLVKALEDINKTLGKIEKNTRKKEDDRLEESTRKTVDNEIRNSTGYDRPPNSPVMGNGELRGPTDGVFNVTITPDPNHGCAEEVMGKIINDLNRKKQKWPRL